MHFGRTEYFFYSVLILASAAAVTDLLWGRIFNWITFPVILLGVAASFLLGGGSMGFDALAGVLAGLLLYGWMFWFGIIGGGDVKLLMAFGALGGGRFAEEIAITGLLLGGLMALLILLFKGRLADFVRRMKIFVLALTVKELDAHLPRVDHRLKMPFGIPIAIAAVWVAREHPMAATLARLGIPLWP